MSVSGIEAIGATQFTPYLPPSVPTEMLGTVTDLGPGSSASSTSGAGGIAALLGEMGLSGAALAQPAGLGSLGSATSGAAGVSGVSGVSGAGAASGDFGSMVLGSIDSLDGLQKTTDQLAVQAATGDLENLHDYTIAATQASVATQVTVAVRNKAVEAFTEIMRMPI